MPAFKDLKPSSVAVHAGTRLDRSSRSAIAPIHRTAAFVFEDVMEMEATFSGRRDDRFIYSRYDNPTLREVEERLAALEGAEAAVAFASGMAALTASFLSLAGAGDHILAQEDLYGGTTRLLAGTLRRMGVEVTFVPTSEMADPGRHLRPETKVVHVESPVNPTLKVVDIEGLARRVSETGAALVVDNTFATPINQRPLSLGAALVVHSATKYLAGHGDLLAGMVAGPAATVEAIREVRKETGGILDPEAAWLLGRSLKTLALRVEAQNRNAMGMARFLAGRPEVAAVHYPGLESHPGHEAAARQMRGFGGMLAFELHGGGPAAARLIGGLEMIRLVPTLGGVETTVLVPAISSHSMIPAEVRASAGVTDGLIRLSAGIEDTEDLIAELGRALEATSR